MSEDYRSIKFDSAAHEVISILASVSEGYGEAETGDFESPVGFVALVILDDTCDLDFTDHTNYPIGDYAGEIARTYGVTSEDVKGNWLVTWDDRGFVYVEGFDSPEAARNEYVCRAARFDVWADEDRDPEDDTYVCPAVGHGYHAI